ncbi:MAG: hypothetical protein HQM13_21550 [SAR324 cluster bacterium]|nr:hypothetical protein [SAR324 cluster bacterium]
MNKIVGILALGAVLFSFAGCADKAYMYSNTIEFNKTKSGVCKKVGTIFANDWNIEEAQCEAREAALEINEKYNTRQGARGVQEKAEQNKNWVANAIVIKRKLNIKGVMQQFEERDAKDDDWFKDFRIWIRKTYADEGVIADAYYCDPAPVEKEM